MLKGLLTALDAQGMERIHRGALTVLEQTGLKIRGRFLLEALADAGCRVDFAQHRAWFKPDLVEKQIAAQRGRYKMVRSSLWYPFCRELPPDDVAAPDDEDRDLLRELATRFDPATWASIYKVNRWMNDMPKKEIIEKYLFSPTLNITGLGSGYTGPGCKTILPHEALAKFDIRLVRGMNSSGMLPKLRCHLDKRGFADVEIRQLSGYEWSRTSYKSSIVQACVKTFRDYGVDPVIWPTSGGSAPMYLFTRKPLNLPLASAGTGHGGRAHAPNEYYVVESNGKIAGLADCEKFFCDVLYKYAAK